MLSWVLCRCFSIASSGLYLSDYPGKFIWKWCFRVWREFHFWKVKHFPPTEASFSDSAELRKVLRDAPKSYIYLIHLFYFLWVWLISNYWTISWIKYNCFQMLLEFNQPQWELSYEILFKFGSKKFLKRISS